MDIFQSRLSRLSGDTLSKYRSVIASLETFLFSHGFSKSELNPQIVEDWTCDLLRRRKPKSTVVRSLNILSSLLKGADRLPMIEAAKRARELARNFGSEPFLIPPLLSEHKFLQVLAVVQSRFRDGTTPDPALDILVLSLLNGCRPLAELGQLKKSEINNFSGLSLMLLQRNLTEKRRFVFDLRQSYLTPRQQLKALGSRLAEKFGEYLELSGQQAETLDPDALVRSLWCAMALHCGATASESLGCITGSASFTLPDFINPIAAVSDSSSLRWNKAVSLLLSQTAPHWYALQMRRGVTFDELRRDIADKITPLPVLFYPCVTIARNLHNRRVLAEQPFISQTVFFRMSPEGVLPMISKIGDKAWCYRMFNSPAAPYAVIPTHEMQRFQSAIGQFTPDMEIHPIGHFKIKPDDKVVLLMADFFNQEATVSKVLEEKDGPVIYRVVFRDNSGFEWTVNADTRQLKKAE